VRCLGTRSATLNRALEPSLRDAEITERDRGIRGCEGTHYASCCAVGGLPEQINVTSAVPRPQGTCLDDPTLCTFAYCTHYTPVYAETTNDNSDCYLENSVQGGDYRRYYTNGFARRDTNNFSSEHNDNLWNLEYDCTNCPSYFGYGYGASTGGTGTTYARAYCGVWYAETGACWTLWHQ